MLAKALHQIRLLGNSPTRERDLANIFSPVRLGTWFLFLNLSLLGSIGFTFYVLSRESAEGFSEPNNVFHNVGLSEILTSVIFLSISAFLTVFVPIRAVGFIFGPRVGRYFDQIVLSGISPLRYVAGKVIAQNVFLAVIVAAALPYFVLCIGLGGISLKFTLLGIAVLWVFTNVLTICTLVLSIYTSEIASLILVVAFFSVAFLSGFSPVTPLPVSTPQIFMAPMLETMHLSHSGIGMVHSLSGLPAQVALFLAASAGVAGVCLVYLLLGPLSCIVQENSTFGEVVMKGDSKRRSFLKKRAMIRRRSEVSFFYENRHPALQKWDFLLRWGVAELLFFGLLLLLQVLPDIIIGLDINLDDAGEELYLYVMLFASAQILASALFFSEDITTERIRFRGIEAGTIDRLFFFSNLVMVLAAAGICLSLIQRDLMESMVAEYQLGIGRWRPVEYHYTVTLAALFVGGFGFYWFYLWLCGRLWSKFGAFALAVFIYGVLAFLLPMIPHVLWAQAGIGRHGLAADLFTVLANLSLTTPISYCLDGYPTAELESLGVAGLWLCLVFHLDFGLFLWLVVARKRKKLPVRELR